MKFDKGGWYWVIQKGGNDEQIIWYSSKSEKCHSIGSCTETFSDDWIALSYLGKESDDSEKERKERDEKLIKALVVWFRNDVDVEEVLEFDEGLEHEFRKVFAEVDKERDK